MTKLFMVLLTLVSAISFTQNSQDRKKIRATRVKKAPKIDGSLEDISWKKAPICTDFVILRPDNGKIVSNEYQTEVKVVYNDDAVFISAKMKDPNPAEIPSEFSIRDNFSQADFFLITINPNDDGQNPFEFLVQVTNNQGDAKVSNGDEDFGWSAVWNSSTKVTNEGWQVEIEIPYRALRFANRPVQSWGFNFHRRLENINEQHTWNYIDNAVGRWTQYDGLIENFENIKPPTRLNLYPYASTIVQDYEGETTLDWNVGMDIKYGLTENFTLDATLVPDFSQVGFDDVELNLSPFEQEFTEQRQFFTEGTELFEKANLFYSRRIGGSPVDQFEVEDSLIEQEEFDATGKKINEEFIDYPEKTTMLNAVKVSGRTKKGLGIGFFNAITQKSEAIIKTTTSTNTNGVITEETTTRKETTSPLTNYNIIVFDQQFNQNSSVTFINTNVARDGHFRDANVSALDWHVETKNSKYNADGSFKVSMLSDDVENPNTGYTFDNSFGYDFENWFWEIGYTFESKDFNSNDLGILFTNDQQSIYKNFGYRILNPKGIFNNYTLNFYNSFNFQHFSGIYTGNNAGIGFWSQLRSRFSFGLNANYSSREKDYFEPRQGTTSGIFFKRPERLNINGWISSNYQKKFAIDANAFHNFYENQQKGYGFGLSPRYRFTNKLSVQYDLNYIKRFNDPGYVDLVDDIVIIGQRGRQDITNSIAGKYSFSTNSSLTLTFRHYWSSVDYNAHFDLQNDGSLLMNTSYIGENVNFNSWNLDLNYFWQFAPGSQMIIFYRNSIFNENENANLNFGENLEDLFNQQQQHTLSIRFVYFIDYQKLKNIFS